MNLRHDEVLADIERRVGSGGASPDEIDCRIAEELGVRADYYLAYLLVSRAIEAYRDARDLRGCLTGDVTTIEAALERAQSLTDSIGWLASTIYQQTADLHSRGGRVAEHAARILGAVLQLRQNLRDAQAAAVAPAPGNGQVAP